MKKIILILIITTVVLAANDNNKIPFARTEIKELFLNNPLSGSQYDPASRKVYGLLSSRGVWHFASIDIETGKITQLKPLPQLTKFSEGAAAIDRDQQRYFFSGSTKGNKYLYVLDINTGEVIYKYRLTRPFKFFAYHGRTDKLYGLSNSEGSYCFVSFDIYAGKEKVISKLPSLSRLKGNARKIDSSRRVFLFEGVFNDRVSLLAVDLEEGKIKTVNAFKVGVNEYQVQPFAKNQPVNLLYAFGVGNCVVVAGYCKTCGLGFLAHISSRFEKVEEILARIEKEIKNKGGKGLAAMNIYVVGGRIRNDASYENALKVYQILKETFALNYQGDKIFHLGMAYNIIIDNGNIDIF